MNQCDRVEKSLDWGSEDLIKVCPGTSHCEWEQYLLYLPHG